MVARPPRPYHLVPRNFSSGIMKMGKTERKRGQTRHRAFYLHKLGLKKQVTLTSRAHDRGPACRCIFMNHEPFSNFNSNFSGIQNLSWCFSLTSGL
jgi:hypothetical protein